MVAKFTEAELLALLKAAREEKAKARKTIGLEVRKHLEECYLPGYLKRTYPDNPEYHSLTLAAVFTIPRADKTPTQYRCPRTGKIWYGKNRRPIGLRGLSKQDLEQHLYQPTHAPAATDSGTAPSEADSRD
jgi:hypothetical protein